MESIINRYYDPFTDQFLSIDPYVSMTDQPYVFTNDNPLNAEDPNGLIPGPQYGARWPKGNLQSEIARYLGPDVGVAKGLKSSKIVFYDVNDPKKEVVYDTKRNYYRISNSSKGRTEYYDRANDTWATNGNLGDQGQANSHYSNTGDSYTSVSDAAQKYGGSSTGDSGGGDEGGGMDGAGFLFGVFPGACGPGGLAMMSKSICNNFQGPGPHKNT